MTDIVKHQGGDNARSDEAEAERQDLATGDAPKPRHSLFRIVQNITPYATIISLTATIVYATIAFFQLNSMNRQFKAAKEANRQNHEQMTIAQRPFVVLQDLETIPFHYYMTNQDVWHFSPILRNAGNTPAIDTQISFIVSPMEKPPLQPPVYAWARQANRFIIGPQGTTWIVPRDVPIKLIERLRDDNGYKIVVAGEVRYGDVFKFRHITEFCVDIFTASINLQSVTRDIIGLPWSYCPWHNCEDEQCGAANQ